MRRFDDNFLEFIKENVLIEDLARNVYDLVEHRKKSTKTYPVFYQGAAYKGAPKFLIDNRNNTYVDTTNMKKGDVIQFVQTKENVDFVTAVKKIAEYYNIDVENKDVELNEDYVKNNVNLQRSVNLKREVKESVAEAEAKAEKWINMYKNMRVNRHFTNDIRSISAELLNYLRDNDKIKYYKTDKYAVIKVPLYLDSKTMCGGQDIYRDSTGKWQKINHGRAGIYHTGNLKNITTLTLTESFFDSLSALQLKYDKTKAKNPFYTFDDLNNDLSTISINGSLSDLKKEAIIDVIKNAGNLERIVFAFDNDEIGHKYEKEITELLRENNLLNSIDIVKVSFGEHKDLNEYLQAKKARESAAPDTQRQAAGKREKEAFITR